MKWFSLIFAIYIFSLCYVPCRDNGNHEEHRIIQTKNGHSDSDKHEHNCCHECSPFCFCNCCRVNTIVSLTFEFHETATIPIEIYTEYKEHSFPEIYSHIWQPPKI